MKTHILEVINGDGVSTFIPRCRFLGIWDGYLLTPTGGTVRFNSLEEARNFLKGRKCIRTIIHEP
jgi:hypothetical protein